MISATIASPETGIESLAKRSDPTSFAAELDSAQHQFADALATMTAEVDAPAGSPQSTESTHVPTPVVDEASADATTVGEIDSAPIIPAVLQLPSTQTAAVPQSEPIIAPDVEVAAPSPQGRTTPSDSLALPEDAPTGEPAVDAAALAVPLGIVGGATPAPLAPVTTETTIAPSVDVADGLAPARAARAVPDAVTPAASAPITTELGPTIPAAAPLAAAMPAAPVTQALAASAPPAPVELASQLSRPLHSLRALGDGSHVLTVTVTPENLGPVTVRAHVAGDVMRVELVAPTDQAREALRSIIGDLRRDLSQGPGQSTLDLSPGDHFTGRDQTPARDTPAVVERDPRPTPRGPVLSSTGLDVLA
jgi:flagellar hook-length control protein FliK